MNDEIRGDGLKSRAGNLIYHLFIDGMSLDEFYSRGVTDLVQMP